MAIRTDSDLMRDLPAGVYGRLLSAASSVSPIAVYVFGSYARGTQSADSDGDLSVVTEAGDGRRAVEGRVAREGVLIGA